MSKKSPFPGMDPWLEDYWGDVHARLTTYTSDRLQPGLPDGLRARIEEYVTIESQDEGYYSRHRVVPDAMITERPGFSSSSQANSVATLSATEAIELPRLVEAPTQRRIQIVDTRSGHRVITSIEFLSPVNKVGRGLEDFRKKQNEFLDGSVNLVEIDLIRSGSWALSIHEEIIPEELKTTYRAVVVRAVRQGYCEYYPIRLSDTLPNLKIPLRSTDADIVLELQPLLDLAYINGGYAGEIDYTRNPGLPLSTPDAEWIDAWLRQCRSKENS